jgi:hypothetical protein
MGFPSDWVDIASTDSDGPEADPIMDKFGNLFGAVSAGSAMEICAVLG